MGRAIVEGRRRRSSSFASVIPLEFYIFGTEVNEWGNRVAQSSIYKLRRRTTYVLMSAQAYCDEKRIPGLALYEFLYDLCSISPSFRSDTSPPSVHGCQM